MVPGQRPLDMAIPMAMVLSGSIFESSRYRLAVGFR